MDQRSLDDRTEAVRIATIQHKAGRRDLLWVAQLQTAQLAAESNLIRLQPIVPSNGRFRRQGRTAASGRLLPEDLSRCTVRCLSDVRLPAHHGARMHFLRPFRPH